MHTVAYSPKDIDRKCPPTPVGMAHTAKSAPTVPEPLFVQDSLKTRFRNKGSETGYAAIVGQCVE
jgi:hypothetical protein